MKKIVIAPDKFKGSLTGLEFCKAVEKGIRKHTKKIKIIHLPLADGGDGTVQVLNYYLKGKIISVQVHDPLHRKTEATYLYSESGKTAFIEMAQASGTELLADGELNPMHTSTYGTGELIKDALDKGVKHIILGIGGSVTNDAGMGMARALGYRFFDEFGNELRGVGEDLNRLSNINTSGVHRRVSQVKIEVACDVNNPLYGTNGAACVYAPQKGALKEMVFELDKGLRNFNRIVKKQFKIDLQKMKGAGAAGGLGAGCVLFLQAQLSSGTELIKRKALLEETIAGADWVITGEGKLDLQSFSGKVIKGVLDSITTQKLALFCGVVELKESNPNRIKIDYISEIRSHAKDHKDSIRNAEKYLIKLSEEFAKTCL